MRIGVTASILSFSYAYSHLERVDNIQCFQLEMSKSAENLKYWVQDRFCLFLKHKMKMVLFQTPLRGKWKHILCRCTHINADFQKHCTSGTQLGFHFLGGLVQFKGGLVQFRGVRLAPNGTNPGLFQIRFQCIWRPGNSHYFGLPQYLFLLVSFIRFFILKKIMSLDQPLIDTNLAIVNFDCFFSRGFYSRFCSNFLCMKLPLNFFIRNY